MEYYSALKSNELSGHGKIKKKLKCMLLTDRSQSGKAPYCLDYNYMTSRKRFKIQRQ